MAIQWYLAAFLALLFSSALSSWSMPTPQEFIMRPPAILHETHLNRIENHLNQRRREFLPFEPSADSQLKHLDETPVNNQKKSVGDQSRIEKDDQTGKSHFTNEFKAALKSSNWNKIMSMDLKGVKVDEIIPALLTSNNPELLKKVLSEGLYDPKTLQSDPNNFLVRDSPVMKIDGQLKIHFDLAMKENKPDFVAVLVSLDLVDVKEVLELSSKNQEFYDALVQNPIIQKRLVTNNDVETIRSLIKKGSVHTRDILKQAEDLKNIYLSSAIVDPKFAKNDLFVRFQKGEWEQLKQMNVKNLNIDDLLDPKDISRLEKQPEVLRYLLSQGSFTLDNVLQAKNSLKPDSSLIPYLESAVDKSLSELKNVNKLSSLVEGKKIKLDRIMDLADEATLKSLVKLQAIQDNLFQSKDVDNVRLLASKDVLTVQEVINLAEKYRNEELKNEFENYQKKSIPIKISLPQTVLHGKYKPVTSPMFDPENYPKVEFKGKIFKPVKKLGQGADGQVVSYQNEQDPSEFVAVKIGLFKETDFKLQNSQQEELHLAKKTNLIKGKTAMLNGYSFTPMKLIKGEPYFDIVVRSKEFQRPDELVQQMNAVDKAIEEMSKSGVEHRDLHFNNIMYDPITNKATIIDFGRSASSSVTNDSGQKFQLNPFADRKRFLVDMWRQLTFIKHENAKLKNRFNYEPVENLIGERWNLADKVESVNAANTGSLTGLLPSKIEKFEELEKQTKSISDKILKKQDDWMALKNLSKQKKHLIREIGSLEHEKLLTDLGANGNPITILNMDHDNKMNANRQKIRDLNKHWNTKLAKAHEEFQQAKLKLEGRSKLKSFLFKSSSPSESSLQESSSSGSSQDPTSKKKKPIFTFLTNS